MVAGVQIRPAAATIDTGDSIVLVVTHCSRETFEQGDLVALLIACDPELAPLGTFTDWSANGIVGGGAAVGTVVSGADNSATYTAPNTVPASNPVAVSVNTTFEGMSAQLVSNITVRGVERWVGTCTSVLLSGVLQIDNLVWELESDNGYTRTYQPSGTVQQTSIVLPGETVSYAPDSHAIGSEDGGMSIDYTEDPPRFSGGGANYWVVNACFQTSGGVYCADWPAGGSWFGAYGEVTADGTKIEGTNVPGPGGELFTFSFTRQE
jgi:hypothetical protein